MFKTAVLKTAKIGDWTIQFRTKNDSAIRLQQNPHLTMSHRFGVDLVVYPWKLFAFSLGLGLRMAYVDIWHSSFRWEGE